LFEKPTMTNAVEMDETQIHTVADSGRSAEGSLNVIFPPQVQLISAKNFAEDPTSG
jgi:hypothetical protein